MSRWAPDPFFLLLEDVEVSHCHGGTPENRWMVYFMESPIKVDDLGVALF